MIFALDTLNVRHISTSALVAYFIGNISAKKYQNPFMCVKVIASQRWDVFETRCTVRRVAMYLGTHRNIGSKRACWPLASDQKTSRINIYFLVGKFAHAGKRNMSSDVAKIVHGGRYPGCNHLCKF